MSDVQFEKKVSIVDVPDTEAGYIAAEVLVDKNGFKLFPIPVKGDALDPLNWTWLQKHAILSIVMALYFMFTYITTTTVPSFPELQTQFDATLEQINWTVAIPALGLAVGPLIWSTPADIIGRRPIMIFGTIITIAATIGAAMSKDFPGYMAARFFQGFGVSPAATVGLAIINDMFFEHERGQKVGLWVLALDMGLLIGPLIGGFVDLVSAQWIQWLTAIFLGVILVAEVLFMPETLYPRDLMLSESSLGAAYSKEIPVVQEGVRRTKSLQYINVQPLPGMNHPKVWDTVVRFGKTFKYAIVPISVMVYCFGWYWWLLSIVTLIPVAYGSYPPHTQGLLFIGLIVGTLFSEIFCSGSLSDWLIVKLAARSGKGKTPEMRIWLLYPASVLTALGLLLWGISIDRNYHWMVGQVAFAFFGAGIQMGNTALAAYVLDAYPMQSMSVIVFYAVLLNFSAFVEPFFIVPWVDAVGFTWTFAAQAIITVFFCVPAFALLHRFGGAIRERNGKPDWVNPEFDHEIVKAVAT
ncbi:Putative major facilitator superfamily, MFS transporter superfamily [Septoria linicola]|uniref:Major facilitator superfamily, MFS transporter superfamily n=1 Tax=Septoria linicola TaxID=215465 RepID=A0A9Q9B5U0_9PEZI|nr:putative major facilitator superfamily, MFS transporter superfamily [Septoria linicola]USW56876.1 Putative major facilitator superfamily, MFS transporter superfamily [Septoria linicola]